MARLVLLLVLAMIFTGSWSMEAYSYTDMSPRTQRYAYGVAYLEGYTVFAGGILSTSTTNLNLVEIYNHYNKTWTTLSLTHARAYIAGAALTKTKVIFGGGNNGDMYYDDLEWLDVTAPTINLLAGNKVACCLLLFTVFLFFVVVCQFCYATFVYLLL
eukprot:Colp12_sorted_trinity150504_noHs@9452